MCHVTSMDYVRDGDRNTGPLFGLFRSSLPLYFTISDNDLNFRAICALKKQNIQILPEPAAGHVTQKFGDFTFSPADKEFQRLGFRFDWFVISRVCTFIKCF